MKPSESIRLVIFDLDGTLIDSSEGIVSAVNYALREEGLDERSFAEIASLIGYPLHVMYDRFGGASFDQFHARFQEHASDTVVVSSRPLPGAEALIPLLVSSGITLGIATNKIRYHLDAILAKHGWEEHFRWTITADEVRQQKPNPEMLEKLAERSNANRDQILYVGDTVNDLDAGRGARIQTVLVDSPYGDDLSATAGAQRVGSLLELTEVILKSRL